MPDIANIKDEVPKLKRILSELYNRLVVSEPMIEIVVPTVPIDNIWAISDQVEVPVKET